MGKHKPVARIDTILPVTGGYALVDTSDDPAPPAYQAIDAPTGLSLTTAIERNAATPTALIAATWAMTQGVMPQRYAIQWSTDSAFPDGTTPGMDALQESATISGLTPATLYYVRVAAVYRAIQSDWSAAASITTAADTTPPAVVAGQAATFTGAGDLVITWTNPTSANFRDAEIKIYNDSGKTVTYATLYDATQRRVWTAAENLAATSGAGDVAVYVEIRARSWGGYFSAAVNASATKSRPANASGLTTSWASDTGAAGAECVITWTPGSDADHWGITVDSVARTVYVPILNYSLDINRLDHSGTPDPVLSLSLLAYDGLGQASATATTATATNAAPAAPTVTLTGGFSLVVCQVTSARAADFLAYEYQWLRDASVVRTLESAASEQQYEIGQTTGDEGTHSWTCKVRQKDVFGQFSTVTTSSAVVAAGLTLDFLRADLSYSDSDANSFTPPSTGTLAALKDDNVASGGPTYAA